MARKAIVPPRTNDPAEVRQFHSNLCRIINDLVSSVPADSTASNVAEVVADLNSFQDAVKGISTS